MIGDNDKVKNRAFKPALQGGFDYASESGFYVGNWNSTVNWLKGNSVETDLYGGYKFKAGDIDMDVGILTYIYPGNSLGNTTEVYGGVALSSVTFKYSSTVSEDYFGWAETVAGSGKKGRNTGYFNVEFSQEVVPRGTLKASVGYTRFSRDIRDAGVPHYTDYSAGGAYDLGDGFSLSAAMAGANRRDYFGSVNNHRLIITLTKIF